MSDPYATNQQLVHPVTAGTDWFGETRGLGISTLEFKLVPPTEDGLFILENRFYAQGGPARHRHLHQDEWFYVVEGVFLFEIGTQRFTLHEGDSVLAPRQIPHVWASIGAGQGRILITFSPAGKMIDFFREVTKANAMPPQDPALWRAHDMELLGPPLAVNALPDE